jgi:nitrate/TMAO reductase-like tetraheme cytochrome c subunit
VIEAQKRIKAMLKLTFTKRRVAITTAAVALLLLVIPAPRFYRHYKQGELCVRCHEISQPYNDWHMSAHRDVPCADCHGGVFTFRTGFHLNNMRRVLRTRSAKHRKSHI